MKKKQVSILLIFILLAVLLSGCAKVQYTWNGGTTYTDAGNDANPAKSYFFFTNSTSIIKLDIDKKTASVFYPAKASAVRQFFAAPEVVDIDSGKDPQLILGDYSGLLESISLKDASSNWKFAKAQGKYIASTITVCNTVIAANTDGFIYFVSIEKTDSGTWAISSVSSFPAKTTKFDTLNTTGVATADLATFWSTKAKAGFDKNALDAFWATPATDGTTIYVPNIGHKVYAIDIATRTEKWPALDLGGALVAEPLLAADGTLYVGSLDGNLFAIDSATGTVLPSWPVKLPGGVWSKPVEKDGKLYIGDQSGKITILDAKTGDVIDSFATSSVILGSGVDIGDFILFGTQSGKIISIDANNKFDENWANSGSGEYNSSLVFNGTNLLVLAQNGDQIFYVFGIDGSQVSGIDTSGIK
jgi:outer membrane protein assembly factor BamB